MTTREHRHLTRTSAVGMAPGYIEAGYLVAVSRGYSLRPTTKFRPTPLETMIGMTEPMGRHAKQWVELCIWRGDDNGRWLHVGKNAPLEDRKPFGGNMLECLNENGAVESGESRIRLQHRAENEIDVCGALLPQSDEPLAKAAQGLAT